MPTQAISGFKGPYSFLSNLYIATVVGDDKQVYASVEHAYQAAKTHSKKQRNQIRLAESPALAKFLGKRATLRDDWDRVKDGIMLELLRSKFDRHPALRSMLIDTGDAELIEGNTWGDTYWGVCDGVGQNKLGKLLMQVREELSA